jgi:cytoskeletal protein CcmA (bactofilin family)
VVVGKDGVVDGHVQTQDAVIGGRITGSLSAASRLELQATAQVDGEVRARRMQLEEGAVLNGKVTMGENAAAKIQMPPPGVKNENEPNRAESEPAA